MINKKIILFFIFMNILVAGASAQSNGLWKPHPGESYSPSTYCGWNRTGLPLEQQKICQKIDGENLPNSYQPNHGEIVTTLVNECNPNGGYSCNNDIFQKVWLVVSSNDGKIIKINMNSIGNTIPREIMLYSAYNNEKFDPRNIKRFLFDCDGSYLDIADLSLGMSYKKRVVKNSIFWKIDNLACSGITIKDKKIYSNANQKNDSGTPEYCSGFSKNSCNRIKKIVDSKRTPLFCEDGFGVTGSGLTEEQLRICYVMKSGY
jgi:hypothetical protein